METTPRQIVAFGGGGFTMESDDPLLDDYVLGDGEGLPAAPVPEALSTAPAAG